MMVFLWTDRLIWLLMVALMGFFYAVRQRRDVCRFWRQVGQQPLGVAAMVVLLFFVLIALLDSVHYLHHHRLYSLLDWLIQPMGRIQQTTYSAPFSVGFDLEAGSVLQPMLMHAGYRVLLWCAVVWLVAQKKWTSFAWKTVFFMGVFLIVLLGAVLDLSHHYHVLGTDKIGQDVLYQTIKSIRTALVIGTVTTLFMLPFAVILGISAGYFKGKVDAFIQYLYTTLSSVPSVLLISASVLSLDVFMARHAQDFPSTVHRADVKLLALCMILGVSGWTPLCRLLRGEALKLSGMDFVLAARVMGVGRFRIMMQHMLPNVMNMIVISAVLDFSGLVLSEAVLSYVGVGVDPGTMSWGNMINAARLELARDPVVWWPLFAAFLFMFSLILATHLFADTVRTAFQNQSSAAL